MHATTNTSALRDYIAGDPAFQRAYERYVPDAAIVARLAAEHPTAHVVVVSEYWCGDSLRLVPRMARILELLPGWTVDVLPWKSKAREAPYRVKAIPTFIVFPDNQQGREEIGRIVERTERATLEEDLLALFH